MATQPGAVMLELGSSGLRRWGGIIDEEFLQELRGQRGMKIYRQMADNSWVVGACLRTIKMLIRQVKWRAEPYEAGTDPTDVERAQFVDQCRCDMSTSWEDTITAPLSMLTFGFAPCEIVYKRRQGGSEDSSRRSKYNDGLVGWRKLPLRAQETIVEWDFDAAGGVSGFWQIAYPSGQRVYIPIEKALLFVTESEKGNPEGRSILRNAYWAWYREKQISVTEAIGISRDLTGVPIGRLPSACFGSGASPEGKASFEALKTVVTQLERNEQEGIVLPSEVQEGSTVHKYDVQLLTTGGKRQFDTSAIIERLNREIATTIFLDLITMGQPNTIQYKGKNMPNLFATALGGWLDMLSGIFNTFAIPRLFQVNGWPLDRLPTLCHGQVEAQDLGVLGAFVSQVTAAGFPWAGDKGIDRHLRRAADFPESPQPPPNAAVTPPADDAADTADDEVE